MCVCVYTQRAYTCVCMCIIDSLKAQVTEQERKLQQKHHECLELAEELRASKAKLQGGGGGGGGGRGVPLVQGGGGGVPLVCINH